MFIKPFLTALLAVTPGILLIGCASGPSPTSGSQPEAVPAMPGQPSDRTAVDHRDSSAFSLGEP
jgi:hypothetical protein